MSKQKVAKPNGAKPRSPKLRQGYIEPDMAPPSVPEIEDAADEVADLYKRRKKAADEEAEAREHLLALLHKHNLRRYEYRNKVVSVDNSEKVSVKTAPKKEGE